MSEKKTTPMAGGVLLAIAIMAGTLIGATYGQPSLGLVIGLGVGIAIAVVLWLVDRSRVGE